MQGISLFGTLCRSALFFDWEILRSDLHCGISFSGHIINDNDENLNMLRSVSKEKSYVPSYSRRVWGLIFYQVFCLDSFTVGGSNEQL